MYYYIFEPPHEAKEYERTAQIKEYLSNLGIAGEMTSPTPGKTVEDLVLSAISKRYSTIIAVGGIELINRVGRALEPHDTVFGIIPFTDHPSITQLIGASDWKSAAEQLKKRHWHPVRLGLINQQLAFITPATITVPAHMSYQLVMPKYSLSGQGGLISISPGRQINSDDSQLLIEITVAAQPKKGGLFAGFLKQKPQPPGNSQFLTKSIEIHTADPLAIVIANTELCSTPISCQPQIKPIKLIIAKGSSLS